MAGQLRLGWVEWTLLILLSLIWGGSFFFNAVALADVPPLTVVLARVGIGAAVLHLVVRAMGLAMPTDRRTWGAFFVMGGLNNFLPFTLIVWGQTTIGSGLASILNATTPLFAVVLAHLLTRDERLTPARAAGVLAGLVGVVAMVGPDALGGLGGDVLGQVAILGAALCYALSGIFGRRFRGQPPMITATGQVTAATVYLLPLVLIVDQPWTLPVPSMAAVASMLGLAVLCTSAAYALYFRILATAGATNLMLVTFLVPIGALVLATAVLNEVIEPRQYLGMALIGCGLAAIDGRVFSWLRRPRVSGP